MCVSACSMWHCRTVTSPPSPIGPMPDGGAGAAVPQTVVDPGRMEREVLADLRVIDGDARVLADEVLLAVGDVHVPVDHVEHALAGHRRLLVARGGERVAQILRDV